MDSCNKRNLGELKEMNMIANERMMLREVAKKYQKMIQADLFGENNKRESNGDGKQCDTQKEARGKIPSVEKVEKFLATIYYTAQMVADVPVVSLILVERLLSLTESNLTIMNWMPVIMSGLLVASKVQDDLSMRNCDFAEFLPWSLKQINVWEREFVQGIKYNVAFSPEEFAKTFVELSLELIAEEKENACNVHCIYQEKMREMIETYDIVGYVLLRLVPEFSKAKPGDNKAFASKVLRKQLPVVQALICKIENELRVA